MLLSVIRRVKDLNWCLVDNTILILVNTNLVFEALSVVCIESILITIPLDAFLVEAGETYNFLPGPNTTQANSAVEILTRLEEERAIIEAIANYLHLPSILACILLG